MIHVLRWVDFSLACTGEIELSLLTVHACTCTVQGKEEEFSRVYQSRRLLLQSSVPVGMARVLAAKTDLLTVERTNNDSVRANTQCSVNKVLIGMVPDRGGRPNETRPPPEMPAFRMRSTQPPQGQQQRRGGASGRGHNKRVQGSESIPVNV